MMTHHSHALLLRTPRSLAVHYLFAAFLMLMATVSLGMAEGDDGLYEPVPDPDSSFIRVITPAGKFATIGAVSITDMQDGTTPYFSVDTGEVTVSADGLDPIIVNVERRGIYSVILKSDGDHVVVTDTIEAKASKADLAFYNLSDLQAVDLFAPRADSNVVEGVTSGEAVAVTLRAPLQLTFEMIQEGEAIAEVTDVDLRRGEGVTIILTGKEGSYGAFGINNSYEF